MAEMDETGQTTIEEDAEAAFLAREQDQLGDIAEATLGFTPSATEVSSSRFELKPIAMPSYRFPFRTLPARDQHPRTLLERAFPARKMTQNS